MTEYIGCDTARELLDAFVDGELPVADQVMVEAHLRWCTTCSARVEDMSIIGAAVRMGAGAASGAGRADERAMTVIQDNVLSRISAEHAQSFAVRVRAMFEDMHLLWPALGACSAVLVCLAGVSTVLYATNEEHPESLAALITTMSDRSGQDPLLLDNTITIPRAINGGPLLDLPDDEATVTLAAVVSSEGRISDFALLQSEREVVTRQDHGRYQRELADLLYQVKQTRFEPAQALTGRRNVAVNMVWYIARTTVKGTARTTDAVNAVPVPVPVRKHEAVKSEAIDPDGVVSVAEAALTTA